MAAKILVVEDDDISRALFESVLRQKGYEVLTAVDGEEAVSLIEQASPSLIFIDVGLPKLNGIEVLSRCRAKGSLNDKKVYALTGSMDPGISTAGFDGVITKPVSVKDFLKLVAKELEACGHQEDTRN